MYVYRVQRSRKSCGEYIYWLLDHVFSTEEKAENYIKDNPMDGYTYKHVVKQEVI